MLAQLENANTNTVITIISAKEIERLSREPYYSNKPYFCKLTFSSRKIEGNNVKFVFDEYSDIFAAKEIIQSMTSTHPKLYM